MKRLIFDLLLLACCIAGFIGFITGFQGEAFVTVFEVTLASALTALCVFGIISSIVCIINDIRKL